MGDLLVWKESTRLTSGSRVRVRHWVGAVDSSHVGVRACVIQYCGSSRVFSRLGRVYGSGIGVEAVDSSHVGVGARVIQYCGSSRVFSRLGRVHHRARVICYIGGVE